MNGVGRGTIVHWQPCWMWWACHNYRGVIERDGCYGMVTHRPLRRQLKRTLIPIRWHLRIRGDGGLLAAIGTAGGQSIARLTEAKM